MAGSETGLSAKQVALGRRLGLGRIVGGRIVFNADEANEIRHRWATRMSMCEEKVPMLEQRAREYAQTLVRDGGYSEEAALARARQCYGLRVFAPHYEPRLSREWQRARLDEAAQGRPGFDERSPYTAAPTSHRVSRKAAP